MGELSRGLRTPERYIPQLESLRGWAILLVVAFHYFGILGGGYSTNGLPEGAPVWLRLIGAGNTGVTLFFVLSGFLLTQPFIQALKNGTQISIRRFYTARLLRIIPLYYAAVFVAWLVSSNTYSAVKALLFLPVGFDIFPFSVPWWSLSTEIQFYLFLPLAMLAMANKKGRLFLAFCGVAWIGLHSVYALAPQWLNGWIPLRLTGSLIDRGFAFLLGCMAAWFYLSRSYEYLRKKTMLLSLIGLTLFICLIFLLQWYGLMGQRPALQAMPFYHDLEAVLWAGLLLCSLGPMSLYTKFFINPIFSHFGTISYSFYLVHVPIQFYLIYPVKVVLGDTGTLTDSKMMAAIVGSFLLSWLLAVICYHCIEMPFLRLKSHLPVLTGKQREVPAKG